MGVRIRFPGTMRKKNPDDLYHIPETFGIIFLYFQVLSFADILEYFWYEILNHARDIYVKGEKILSL